MASTKSKKPAAQVPAPEAQDEQITLVGRLTRDPELRHTGSGKSVTTIRIAVNNGDQVSFHSVVAWNKTADAVCKYLKKGRPVEVTGRSQERTYTADDGSQRTVTEIVAWQVQFISRQKASASSATSQKEVA
jgi:single-strand DNA-binding protein